MLSAAARLWRNPALIRRSMREWLHSHSQWGFDSGTEQQSCDAMLAVTGWLQRAQLAWPNGGIASRYDLLGRRFQPQYPETTGYLVPTLLNLAAEHDYEDARAIALRAGEWLLTRQLSNGAIDCRSDATTVTRNDPQVYLFDCAAILQAFVALHRDSPQGPWAEALVRLADFLISEQLPSGEWDTLLYFPYFGSHQALSACALIDAGQAVDRPAYIDAGTRCLDAIRPNLLSNGYVTKCHFTNHAHGDFAFLHPLSYTLEGFFKSGQLLGRSDYVDAVRPALAMLQRRFEVSRRLPASHYNAEWKAVTDYSALDADCQIAALWFQAGKAFGDWSYISSALKLMDLVRSTIDFDAVDSGIRGGIAGSFPVYGRNQQFLCINWAPKYFIDASLLEVAFRREAGSW